MEVALFTLRSSRTTLSTHTIECWLDLNPGPVKPSLGLPLPSSTAALIGGTPFLWVVDPYHTAL
jgi:hypothetical protein